MSHFVIFLNRSTELSNLAYFKQYSYFSHSCSQCVHSFPIHVHSFPIRVLSFPIRVHSCSLVFIRFHSCSLVFIRVHSCSFVFHSCSLVFHSCSLVFTRVHSCSTRVPLVFTRVHSCSFVFTRVHSCSDLCGVLDKIQLETPRTSGDKVIRFCYNFSTQRVMARARYTSHCFWSATYVLLSTEQRKINDTEEKYSKSLVCS